MNLIEQIKSVENEFTFYGFLAPPIERKRIASLLIRGFSIEDIYNFGCDAYCGV